MTKNKPVKRYLSDYAQYYQWAFPSCAFSVSRNFLEAFNNGEYDELLENIVLKLEGEHEENGE